VFDRRGSCGGGAGGGGAEVAFVHNTFYSGRVNFDGNLW